LSTTAPARAEPQPQMDLAASTPPYSRGTSTGAGLQQRPVSIRVTSAEASLRRGARASELLPR